MGTKIDGLSGAVERILNMYSDSVLNELEIAAEDVSAEAKKMIAKIGEYEDRTGKYRKGFYLKKKVGSKYKTGYVLANKKYQLTHLLENGYEIHGGTARTKDFPHWKPTEEFVQEEYLKRVEGALRQ